MRLRIILPVLAMIAAFLGGYIAVAPQLIFFPLETEMRKQYDRIAIGMTLSEVEALIGSQPEELEQEQLPRIRSDRKVVDGDRFYEWTGPVNRQRIIIGIRDRRVCDKWYCEDDL